MSRFFSFFVLFLITSSILASGFSFTALVNPTRPYSSDLTAFMTGAAILRFRQGANLYNLTTQAVVQKRLIYPYVLKLDLLPFMSPPYVAAIFFPLTYVPLSVSYFVIFCFNLILWIVIALFSLHLFPRLLRFRFWPLFFFGFLPLHQSLQLSQLTPIIILALIFTYFNISRSRFFSAGLVFSLLLAKPQYFLVGLPLFVLISSHRARFLAGSFIGLVTALVISLFLTGLPALLSYPKFLIATQTAGLGSDLRASLGFPLLPTLILYPIFLLLFANFRNKFYLLYSTLLATLALPVFAFHVMASDMATLLLPVLILFQSGLSTPITIACLLYFLTNLLFTTFPRILALVIIALAFYILFNREARINT